MRMLRPAAARDGMTLVEMLVAITATLILMGAVAQMFSVFGTAISGSRAVLDLDAQLRNAAWRLRSDLAGATARPLPPLSADSGEGYFEIIEGPATDRTAAANNTAVAAGDCDDVLLFTARNTETPFIGRAPGTGSAITDTFESTLAEIGWFARPTLPATTPVTYTLYRKQLLVMGYVGADPFSTSNSNSRSLGAAPFTADPSRIWSIFFNMPCDVSVRREENRLYPNALADLARREFRFMHNLSGTTSAARFPFPFVNHQEPSSDLTQEVLPAAIDGLIFDSTSQRYGEDVILTNILAFDVRVFDPAAPVGASPSGEAAIVPGDQASLPTAVASGCYVDLGNGVASNSLLESLGGTIYPSFSGAGQVKSKLVTSGTRTFDAWSTHYEANGIDEDGIHGADQGTDGLDNDNDGNADERPYSATGQPTFTDTEETETLPPYPSPLRGIEVRIRCYEPSSRQVRQVTVRHTFVPH
jgi:prepilin-type N-terminal cleavage/methylation domain-containing protein